MLTKDRIAHYLYLFVTTLIIVAPALYNRYPLVYFDSGAYMEMAASLEPSFHRAIGYPLLMRIFGLMVSNWPIVLLQSLLLNMLLFRVCVSLFERTARVKHFVSVVVLVFGTSMGWYAGQLMPDIFTLILVIATLSLLLETVFNWKMIMVYSLIIFISSITHLSHIPLLLLAILSIIVLKKHLGFNFFRMRLITLGATLFASVLFTCSYNAAYGHGFRLSLATNVFLTANIAEMGFLKLYLDENCPDAPEELCAIKDNIPKETGGFLWAGDGPVQISGPDWPGLNERWSGVVSDFLLKPRYLKWFLFGSVKSTIQQMFQIELGSGLQYTYGEGSPPSWPMQTHFKQELNEYYTSIQNKNADHLPLPFFKAVNYITLFLAMLLLGWALLSGHLSQRMVTILIVITIFYFFNAAITGVLANVYERLQCRLLPLYPMLALWVWFEVWHLVWPKSSVPD